MQESKWETAAKPFQIKKTQQPVINFIKTHLPSNSHCAVATFQHFLLFLFLPLFKHLLFDKNEQKHYVHVNIVRNDCIDPVMDIMLII